MDTRRRRKTDTILSLETIYNYVQTNKKASISEIAYQLITNGNNIQYILNLFKLTLDDLKNLQLDQLKAIDGYKINHRIILKEQYSIQDILNIAQNYQLKSINDLAVHLGVTVRDINKLMKKLNIDELTYKEPEENKLRIQKMRIKFNFNTKIKNLKKVLDFSNLNSFIPSLLNTQPSQESFTQTTINPIQASKQVLSLKSIHAHIQIANVLNQPITLATISKYFGTNNNNIKLILTKFNLTIDDLKNKMDIDIKKIKDHQTDYRIDIDDYRLQDIIDIAEISEAWTMPLLAEKLGVTDYNLKKTIESLGLTLEDLLYRENKHDERCKDLKTRGYNLDENIGTLKKMALPKLNQPIIFPSQTFQSLQSFQTFFQPWTVDTVNANIPQKTKFNEFYTDDEQLQKRPRIVTDDETVSDHIAVEDTLFHDLSTLLSDTTKDTVNPDIEQQLSELEKQLSSYKK